MPPLTIRLSAADNVVVARADILPGTEIPGERVTARGHVPAGHKLATAPVASGEPVRKYNQIIGFATTAIVPGDHVHTHNVAMGNFARDYAFCADAKPTVFVPERERATFEGIVRA
ncbi:MAG: UxaA family hydrolase, partial [Stellaceae bacterium]